MPNFEGQPRMLSPTSSLLPLEMQKPLKPDRPAKPQQPLERPRVALRSRLSIRDHQVDPADVFKAMYGRELERSVRTGVVRQSE